MSPRRPGRASRAIFDSRTYLPFGLFAAITDARVDRPDIVREEAEKRQRRNRLTENGRLVILAADHPARMVVHTKRDPLGLANRHDYLARVVRALTAPGVDGVMGSPDILEDQVTYPIVTAMLGAPKVKAVRAFTDFGFSYVYIIFQDGTDLYWARSRVLEYLSYVGAQLPEGVRPDLGTMASARLYGRDQMYQAKLRELSDAADPASRTFAARYVLEGEAASAPLGSTVTVTLLTKQSSGNQSVLVPVGAVYDCGRGPGVWIVNDKSEVKFRSVTIASIGKEEVVVSRGIEAGEKVVALGAHLLHEGQAVDPADEEAMYHARF